MATQIKTTTATLELTSMKLTRSLIKQMPRLSYQDLKGCLAWDGATQSYKSDKVVGWLHGCVTGDDWKRWLLVQIDEGSYGLAEVMESSCKGFKQIFIG